MSILFILITAYKSFSCTCAPPFYFNFIDASLHPIFENNQEIIVQAKVLSFSPDNYFMEVDVIEEIQGTLTSNKIIVSGQDGMNCAVPLGIGLFILSDTLILRLTSDFYNRTDTFELNDCSLNFLKYSNGQVLGNIDTIETEMTYPDFKSLIIFGIVNSIINNQSKNNLNVFPNPADNYLTIENKKELLLNISIYDLSGRLIKNIIDFPAGGIDISDLKGGVYIIQYSSRNSQYNQVQKFVKNSEI